MFTGFIYGVIAAFFWSLTNIIDKYLTKRHASDGNVWGIVILSCFFPAILLPIALSLTSARTVVLPTTDITILITSGALMVAWIYFYLKALTEDDTSVVMTLLVLAPLFALIFSNIILGELPTPTQILAGALLVLGSLVVSYEPSSKSLKLKLLAYALGASTVMGLMHALFKFSTIEGEFWVSMFWRSVGMIAAGFLLCLMLPAVRARFVSFIRHYFKQGFTLNSTNESLTLVGDTLFGAAILLAPIALIQTTEAYQPIFILIMSFLLGKLGIDSVREDYSKSKMKQKIVGIVLVILGSLILIFNNLG